MKKVLFRADAKPSIGVGDLMSLVQLSRYFARDDWQCHFMIRNYTAGKALAEKHGIAPVLLQQGLSIPEEVREINTYCQEHGIHLLFLEITEFPLSSYTGLSKKVKKACVSFDGAIPSDLDLVVDWDIEANTFFSPSVYPGTRFLLGPEYVILPIEFSSADTAFRFYRFPCENILVTMGGADEFNFTQKVAEALAGSTLDIRLTLILGPGYEYQVQLERRLCEISLQATIKCNVTNMLEEYLSCDAAIGAGGLTASEVVATRTPAILISTYEHQIARCEYFHKRGWVEYLGFQRAEPTDLQQALTKALSRPLPVPSIEDTRLFDTNRIVQACNEIVSKN